MKSLFTNLTLMLLAGAPTLDNQSACEKAGKKWDAGATSAKCNSGFA
jgi:hypothetical protein